jgi:DNA-binding transcriptional regulator YiaG
MSMLTQKKVKDDFDEIFGDDIAAVNAFIAGNREGCTVKSIETPDLSVKRIREDLNLTQAEFAQQYGFSVRTVENWEFNESRGKPLKKGVAGLFLRLIDKYPREIADLVQKTLSKELSSTM